MDFRLFLLSRCLLSIDWFLLPDLASRQKMNSSFFHDKTILVTGAGSGLGRELALRLCRNGAKVTALSKTAEKLESLRLEVQGMGSGSCEVLSCNVTHRDEVIRRLQNEPIE